MKIGSLFSGYGGLEMGVQAVLGGEVAWHVEFDPAPSKILAHRYPGVPNYGDITTVDWSSVEPVDVLTGGFPCQDLSLAGRRKGMRPGTRSGLWADYLKAIHALRPEFAVIENVRGLLSGCAESRADSDLGPCPRCADPDSGVGHAPNVRALGRVLIDLASIGYDTRWVGLRAADAGAPHRRFRVFVLAHPAGEPWRVGNRDDVPSRRGAIRREPTTGAGIAPHAEHVVGYGTGRAWHGWPEPTDGSLADTSRERFGEHTGESPTEEARAASGDITDGDGRPRPATDWGPYQPAIRRWERVLGRVAPAPTEPTGQGGAQRLSPAFVEFMMGLPAGWLTAPEVGLTRAQQLKALGNGVVPQQAALAVRSLLEAEAVAA